MQQEFPMRQFGLGVLSIGLGLVLPHLAPAGSGHDSHGGSAHGSGNGKTTGVATAAIHLPSNGGSKDKTSPGKQWTGSRATFSKPQSNLERLIKGRDFRGLHHAWSHYCWSRMYGCYCYYCPIYRCWYYWSEASCCFYPVIYLTLATDVPVTMAADGAATASADEGPVPLDPDGPSAP
jgi:hypothetical protein